MFRSKVDWWLAAMVAATVATPAILGFLNVAAGHSSAGGISLILTSLIVVALVFACAVPMQYEFTNTELVIRSGLLRVKVGYSCICRVQPTNSPLSSWAWSLDRLELVLSDGDRLIISPVQTREFVAELMKRAPHVDNRSSMYSSHP
jgi:hypothetical protein